MLPDDPAAVLHQPGIPVNLAEQDDIGPAGLFGKLTTRGGRIGLAGVQAPAGSSPVPPIRQNIVVPQQQDTATRIEHDDPAGAP